MAGRANPAILPTEAARAVEVVNRHQLNFGIIWVLITQVFFKFFS